MFPYTKEYFTKALMAKGPIGKVFPSKEWTDETLDWFDNDNEKKTRRLVSNKGWKWIKGGRAEGLILGGCITSMMHLRGTKYWPDFSKKVLFWEIPEGDDFSKGENVANIDAYLTDLKLSGVFEQISGMIIGRPFGYNEENVRNLIDVVKRQINGYEFPVLFGIDIGHSDPMITIPIGVSVIIDSIGNTLEFIESGVV
jgi:muramoyltetrapeptide carboxypeptidase